MARDLIRELDELEEYARARAPQVGSEEALEALRIELLGRKEGENRAWTRTKVDSSRSSRRSG